MAKFGRPVDHDDGTRLIDVVNVPGDVQEPLAWLDMMFKNHRAEWEADGEWFVKVPDDIIAGAIKQQDGTFQNPQIPTPNLIPIPLTEIGFITLCQEAGGMTDAQLVACKSDPIFAAMWIKFQAAPEISLSDKRVSDGISALGQAGYLPNGAEVVAAAWPRRE